MCSHCRTEKRRYWCSMGSFGKIPERPPKSRPCMGCRARNGRGGGTSRAQSAARSWPRQSTEEGQMRERARGRRKRRGAESQQGVEKELRKQYRGGIRVQLVSVAVVVVVSVAPSVVVSVVVSSSCPPSCPPGNFDGKSARQRHETLASLLSRPCQGEQRSEVSCQEHSALLSKTQQCHCWPL